MATFINPFVDRGFKLLFGREENKDLLIDLLNGLFEGERVITEHLSGDALFQKERGRM